MERTREKERNVRDNLHAHQEWRQTPMQASRVKQPDPYELSLKCYLAAPSHLTA
jgi:hypothetical protein